MVGAVLQDSQSGNRPNRDSAANLKKMESQLAGHLQDSRQEEIYNIRSRNICTEYRFHAKTSLAVLSGIMDPVFVLRHFPSSPSQLERCGLPESHLKLSAVRRTFHRFSDPQIRNAVDVPVDLACPLSIVTLVLVVLESECSPSPL